MEIAMVTGGNPKVELGCPRFPRRVDTARRPAMEAEPKQHAAPGGEDVTTKIDQDAGHVLLADYRSSHHENPKFELWTDITAYFGKRLKLEARWLQG